MFFFNILIKPSMSQVVPLMSNIIQLEHFKSEISSVSNNVQENLTGSSAWKKNRLFTTNNHNKSQ